MVADKGRISWRSLSQSVLDPTNESQLYVDYWKWSWSKYLMYLLRASKHRANPFLFLIIMWAKRSLSSRLWFLAFHLLMSLIQIVARWKADNGRTDLPPPPDKAKKYINLKNRIVQVTQLYNKSNSASLPNDIICEYSEKGNSTCKILRVAS